MNTSSTSLQGLGHEQLVSLVRGTVGSARPSAARPTSGRVDAGLYRRDPRVPAVRIETYPRRRRARVAAVSLAAPISASVSASRPPRPTRCRPEAGPMTFAQRILADQVGDHVSYFDTALDDTDDLD
jgi:hypothetical protein